MRSITILRGGWKGEGRRFRRSVRSVSCGTLVSEVVDENLVVSHKPPYPHTSPCIYPLTEVLHHRIEPGFDKGKGRSSKSQSGYDVLGCEF